MIGRFINADGYMTTGQGFIGYNMYAYCGNNPVNRIDSTGQIWWIIPVVVLPLILAGCSKESKSEPLPYNSADDAARAFSEEVYSSSQYIRHEYGTEIYSKTINGKTTYDYNPPRVGGPHNVNVGYSTPKGTKTVAYAHTHPMSNEFSHDDRKLANKKFTDIYVATPSMELLRYSWLYGETTSVCKINPTPLTNKQRDSLVADYRVSWDTHIKIGCVHCSTIAWPAE